jgi:hypothetical protein
MHKLPTKEQKFKIYTLALELYSKHPDVLGMCWAIASAQRKLEYLPINKDNPSKIRFLLESVIHEPENNMEANFPEIYQYKPKSKWVSEFWWDVPSEYGRHKRIKILKAAIEACKPIKKKL